MADPETAGPRWHDLGELEELRRTPLRQVVVGQTRIALSFTDGRFGAVSGNCNHAGSPLGDGTLDADGYIVCPWQRAGGGRADARLLRRDRLHVPAVPYIAHSRGWSAEDMENNVAFVQMSEALRDSSRQLVDRTLAAARAAVESDCGARTVDRAGRKAGAPPAEPLVATS